MLALKMTKNGVCDLHVHILELEYQIALNLEVKKNRVDGLRGGLPPLEGIWDGRPPPLFWGWPNRPFNLEVVVNHP